MSAQHESAKRSFARIQFGWLGYMIYSAACAYALMLAFDPLVTQTLAVNFRGDHAAPPMTRVHWIGAGLAVCVYFAGAVYAGCIERTGAWRLKREAIVAALSVTTVLRGIALFLLPIVATIATGAALIAAGLHGATLFIVPIGALLANWLCFIAVAWFRPSRLTSHERRNRRST
ncbi:hypothetical protein [Paraburkholderia sp. J94]|uniref:hypothetical protein n=1 Tax=Paraburkholderia sp. J94 TaxID=2805441 RepID=UPI002AB122A4|nr:hypothetical protein [Paraburkholderia sp. J94]